MSEQEIIDNWLNMRQQQPVQLATQEAYWQHYRIQASIAAMQAFIGVPQIPFGHIAEESVKLADALVKELQKKDDNANIQQ